MPQVVAQERDGAADEAEPPEAAEPGDVVEWPPGDGDRVVGAAVGEVPMHDLVEIGAFADGSGEERGAPVYRRLHRIRSGAQRLTRTVLAAATWAGVDPRSLLFDLKPWNNVARLPQRGVRALSHWAPARRLTLHLDCAEPDRS